MEATKKPGSMVPRTAEFILLNSASRKPGDRTFPAENAGNPEDSRKVRTAEHGFSNT